MECEGKGDFPRDGFFNTAMDYTFTFRYPDGVEIVCKQQAPRGVKFVGDKGWIFVYIHGGNLEASPSSLLKEIIGPNEIHLGRSPGHHRDFLNNVRSRGDCFAAPEIGHRTATMCHMANIAMRLEPRSRDGQELFINDDEANRMLHVPQRSPRRLCRNRPKTMRVKTHAGAFFDGGAAVLPISAHRRRISTKRCRR